MERQYQIWNIQTILQISFTSFILLFTTIIFGYLLNIIGIILSEIDQEEENQRRDINQINKYMRKRCISKQTILKIIMGLQIQFKQNKRGLSRAINLDLEYYYLHNFKKDEEQNQIALSKISNNLYEDLKKEYFGRFLNKITFLSEKFSKQTLQKLVLCIDEQNYLPGQIISNNNEQGKENQLIYIIEGKVELIKNCFSNSEGQFAISVIGKDKIIGQIPFFEGRSNDITIKSTDFTQILVISREKFLEIVQQNEQDYQLFCRIKDYIGLYSNYEDLGIKCEICNKFTHNFNDCPLVHIDKADVNIKINFQQSLLQKRSAWKRKDYDYINTLLNQNNVQDKFQLFNMNNNVEQFFVTSPYLKSQSDVPQEYDLSEKDLEMKVTVNTNHARTYTHIRTNEDEEAKLYVQEKVKNQIKRQKMKRGSQQLCINLDSQLSSALEDTLQSSNSSNKEKHQKETSTGIINQDNQNSKSIIQTQNHSSHNQQQLAKFFTNNFSISQRNNKFELTLKKLLLDLFAIIQREEATALQQNQQINNNCIIWEFDQRRDYTIYFPKGNSDRIIRAYNFKSRQNLNRLKRKKQLNK